MKKMTLLKSTHDPTYSPFVSCFEMDESKKNGRERSGGGRTRRRENAGEAQRNTRTQR